MTIQTCASIKIVIPDGNGGDRGGVRFAELDRPKDFLPSAEF
jgi:hypothetical protein